MLVYMRFVRCTHTHAHTDFSGADAGHVLGGGLTVLHISVDQRPMTTIYNQTRVSIHAHIHTRTRIS